MPTSLRAAMVVALVSSGLWVGGGASPAYAYSGYQVVENTVNLPANSGYERLVASCPSGTVVLGGGAQIVGDGSANFEDELNESSPVVGGLTPGWMAAVSSVYPTSLTFGVFAVCGAAPSGYQVLFDPVTLAFGGSTTHGTQCPSGKVALSGGEYIAAEGRSAVNIEIDESGPATNTAGSLWETTVGNLSGSTQTVELGAVCADPPTGYQVMQESFALSAGMGFDRDIVSCPAGKVVLGGGALVTGSGNGSFATEVQETAPGTDSGGSVWLNAVSNNSTLALTLGMYAVCVS